MKHQRPVPASMPAGLLGAPDFLRLWAIGGIANAVRWLEVLAAALFTLDATGSGMMVAMVTAGRSLPLIVMGGFAGVLSDALDRKRILIGGMLLMAAASGAVCALSLAGLLTPWHMLAAGLVTGAVYGTEMPARRRMVGESVPPPLVGRAVALDSVTGSLTRVAGPLAGGIVYQWFGVSAAFAATGLLSLLAAALASGVDWRQQTRALALGGVLRDLAEGAAFVWRTPALLALLGVTVAMNLFGFAYTSLMAPIGEQVFRAAPALVGVLAAAEPAGASLGGLLIALFGLPRLDPVWQLLGGVAVFLALMALLPLAPMLWTSGFWPACALMLAGGLGVAVFTNLQVTIGLTESSFAVRSRVMGLITTAIGTWPLGMLIAGALGDALGPLWALTALGSCGLLFLIAVGALYARQRR